MSRIRKTPDQVIQVLDQLLDICSDGETAARLNELGHRNWQGKPFTAKKVAFIRTTYGLRSRYQRLRDRGLLTAQELAKQLNVSPTTIHTWGREGLLQRELYGNAKRCLYLPLGSKLLLKGQGGRRPRPPAPINVQCTEQETV